jgi:tRNA (mo5U34)-methyltransferase
MDSWLLKAQDARSGEWFRQQVEILNRKGLYHSIELPDGRVLEGVQSIEHLKMRLSQFPAPEDLTGKRVLDIGAWDGWFSFEMERRGAEVMAVDCVEMEKFRLAHELLGSKVDYRVMDVDELSPATVGRFDIVMFLGVLYHLRHPLLALERICQLTRDMAFVESFVTDEELKPGQPLMEFYETSELGGQTDNWYGPSTSCLHALCRSAGFARVVPGPVIGQRGHVTCYRHWEPPPEAPAAEAPTLTGAANNRDWSNRFPKNKDLYLCCFFSTTEAGLKRSDVRVDLDGYGVPSLSVAPNGGGWQANCWLPSGLEPGSHEVRVRTVNSGFSNALTIEVLPAINSPLPF